MPTEHLTEPPMIAILRGVLPERCVEVAEVLYRAGIRAIEVPLNSPDPYASIAALSAHFDNKCLIGAGTVLSAMDVQRTRDAGGRLIVAPNVDTEVIHNGLQLGLEVVPGIATATEAFLAIRAGATRLKLFPAATYGPHHLKALKSVLPKNVMVFPVGGIGAQDVKPWLEAGADGFGFGSELFRPTFGLAQIEQRARELVAAVAAGKAGI